MGPVIVKLTNCNALKSRVFDHKSPRVAKNGDDAVPLETVESLLWAGGGDNMLMLIPHSHLICHLSSASCDVSAEITKHGANGERFNKFHPVLLVQQTSVVLGQCKSVVSASRPA